MSSVKKFNSYKQILTSEEQICRSEPFPYCEFSYSIYFIDMVYFGKMTIVTCSNFDMFRFWMAAEVINLERSILITGDKTNFHANGKLSTVSKGTAILD
jgi:hypothetical protein